MQIADLGTDARRTGQVASRILISAPVERVWDYTVDPNRWPDWCRTIKAAQILDDVRLGVGMRFMLKQPLQSLRTWEVTELIPQRTAAWRTVDGRPRFEARHMLAERSDGVESTLELHFERFGRPLNVFVSAAFKIALLQENWALKRVCEASH